MGGMLAFYKMLLTTVTTSQPKVFWMHVVLSPNLVEVNKAHVDSPPKSTKKSRDTCLPCPDVTQSLLLLAQHLRRLALVKLKQLLAVPPITLQMKRLTAGHIKDVLVMVALVLWQTR
jgi:hypothetical protein